MVVWRRCGAHHIFDAVTCCLPSDVLHVLSAPVKHGWVTIQQRWHDGHAKHGWNCLPCCSHEVKHVFLCHGLWYIFYQQSAVNLYSVTQPRMQLLCQLPAQNEPESDANSCMLIHATAFACNEHLESKPGPHWSRVFVQVVLPLSIDVAFWY
jgi:hypothetical protein